MELTPREKDKLLLFNAFQLAERRKNRGLKLNYPEAVAYISFQIIEGARDGKSVAELMSEGKNLLTTEDVMEGIEQMITEVQVEATFPDGTKLVTVHNPVKPVTASNETAEVGEIIAESGEITINQDRRRLRLVVANSGDRPIQVGSHFHFYEVNRALAFEREKARGFRLNIAAGTAVRFEPGQEREIELVEFAGNRAVYGFQAQIMGEI